MSISNTYTTLNAYIFGTRSGHAGIAIINDNSAELLTEAQFWETVIGYLENEEDDVAELLAEARELAAEHDTDEYVEYLESRGVTIQTIDELLELNSDSELVSDGETLEAATDRLMTDINEEVAIWNSVDERSYMLRPSRRDVLEYLAKRFANKG